ncbi:hypothetical protein GCM10017608_36140 [Agromyces luteolus]|uniref:Uncharacterized protein n=1 Tax=Agromyces luteolus TaxID=88373 RepID=A0A7C9HJZ5_9MICO|nr:hypothetical protein [Agromyces luteolus]MUN06804.1 hypothetical protein [Agromyces luteolus]GLK29676.1 hypothetical protein GCM10017608_36140 [Agromyces luteolus]
MSSVIDRPDHGTDRAARPLPSIGVWWPMLEGPLQREILEHPTAPLRAAVVRRILELCEQDDRPVPRSGVRLDENERAYLAGWTHAADWT